MDNRIFCAILSLKGWDVLMEIKHYSASDYTKRAMAASLKHLMIQKPLEKISIREIMEGCGMKRQNFYYHFEDIYALLKWMFHEEVVQPLRQHEGVLFWQDGLLQLFRYLQENKAVCQCALRSLGRPFMKDLFMNEVDAMVRHVADQLAMSLEWPEKERELEMVTRFYVIALSGVIESWVLDELDYTPEELISFADTLLNDHICGILMRLGGGRLHL